MTVGELRARMAEAGDDYAVLVQSTWDDASAAHMVRGDVEVVHTLRRVVVHGPAPE